MKASQRAGYNIAKHRKRLGLTQEQLAAVAGVTDEYISQLENQKRNPSVDIVEALCDALGVDIGDIFKEPKRKS